MSWAGVEAKRGGPPRMFTVWNAPDMEGMAGRPIAWPGVLDAGRPPASHDMSSLSPEACKWHWPCLIQMVCVEQGQRPAPTCKRPDPLWLRHIQLHLQ